MGPAVILRVATLGLLALFAVGAVPAHSSPLGVTPHAGVSLQRVSMKPGAPVRHGAKRPVQLPVRVADPVAYRREKAEAEAGYQRWLRDHPLATGASGAGGRSTSVSGGLNHTGLAASDQAVPPTPPDTTGAVGPSDYVEMVNSELAVYNKTDLSTPTETIDEARFVGVPRDLTCDGNVQWDQEAGRWLYSAIGCLFPREHGALYFGWSKTSSPSLTAGNWCQYAINTGSNIDDYPKLGHDDSQILIGVNEFSLDGHDVHPKLYMLDKPANGDTGCPAVTTEESTAGVLTFPTPSFGGAWTPVPANLADSSAVGYVVAIDTDRRHLHLFTVGRDSSQKNVLLSARKIRVPEFCFPPSVPQHGTRARIESLDMRLTQAVAVADPSTGHEGIWTQHTVSACRPHHFQVSPSVVRWYELAPGASTPRQTGTVRGASGAFAFMGAISPSSDGQDAAIFYNTSSSKTLPDFRVRDRHFDTKGGQMIEDVQLTTSTSPDADRSCPFTCRWGDYNGASPDPSDPSLIWGTGELTVVPPDAVKFAPQWGSENAAIDVTPAATYGLQVTVTDRRSGTGSVSSSPAGIASCTSSCSYDYVYGTHVQLVATPGAHSALVRWSGDCSGRSSCSVPMGGPENVKAWFVPQPETLSYRRTGNGSGSVTFSPIGGNCSSRCSVRFDYGTRVRLRATAAPGSVFEGWSGACKGSGACKVSMRGAKRVSAMFSKIP
jgi:hypothetical protein